MTSGLTYIFVLESTFLPKNLAAVTKCLSIATRPWDLQGMKRLKVLKLSSLEFTKPLWPLKYVLTCMFKHSGERNHKSNFQLQGATFSES